MNKLRDENDKLKVRPDHKLDWRELAFSLCFYFKFKELLFFYAF
jgi:hypothetical protein